MTRLNGMGADNDLRLTAIIGQCAHESVDYKARFENLNYSADGLWRVFRRHFVSRSERDLNARQPEKISNRVYANRIGNGSEASGDGYRYRGRGYLQLTGRANYRAYGTNLGIDLEGTPDLAAEPEIAWLVVIRYMAKIKRSGKTALQWADASDVVMLPSASMAVQTGLQIAR